MERVIEERPESRESEDKNIVVTPRDLDLLKLILEQKFLTFEQIQKQFFPGPRISAQKERLRKLACSGLIRTQKVYTQRKQIYLLHVLGYRHLEGLGLNHGLGFTEAVDLRSFEHDKVLTDIRFALEAQGIHGWKSEKILKNRHERGRIPDAAFTLNNKEVALEFENSDKGVLRYKEIFLAHSRGRYPRVLYVVRDPEHMKFLGSLAENLGRTEAAFNISRFTFAKEKGVLDHGLKGLVYNLKRGLVKLGDI